MLRDPRGTGARGVVGSYHTSHSLAARVAQHEDEWERVSNMFVILEFVIHRLKNS